MGYATPWKSPTTHKTYRRGDPITITGTIYYSADGTSGSHGYFTNRRLYFYGYFTANWDVRVPICVGNSAGTAWAFVYESSIVSGGTPEKHKVIYNGNGGTYNGNATWSEQVTYNVDYYTYSNFFTRHGYHWIGWNESPNGKGTDWTNWVGKPWRYTYTRDTTLYAQWAVDKYNVSYNANGGAGAPGAQTKTFGLNLTLSGVKPYRTGYIFSHWNTAANGNGTNYWPGSTYSSNSGVTLYAQWTPITYYVQFNANGGYGSTSGMTVKYNQVRSLSSNGFSRVGYRFAGWATRSDGGGSLYSNGQNIQNLSSSNGATITLYARWTANTYTVRYNSNGGSGSMADTGHTYGSRSYLRANAFSKYGHTFAGWSTIKEGNVELSDGAAITSLTAVHGNVVTLYAVWSTVWHRLTLDAETNHGSSNTEIDVSHGSSMGLRMPVPTRKNYVFLGWFTEPTGGTLIDRDYIITGPMKLYAQFKIDASVCVQVNGKAISGIPYVQVNGKSKKGYAYVKVNGTWKHGVGKG